MEIQEKEGNEWSEASERESRAQIVIWNLVSRVTLTRKKFMWVFESGHKENPAVPGRLKLRMESKNCFPIYLLPLFTQGHIPFQLKTTFLPCSYL